MGEKLRFFERDYSKPLHLPDLYYQLNLKKKNHFLQDVLSNSVSFDSLSVDNKKGYQNNKLFIDLARTYEHRLSPSELFKFAYDNQLYGAKVRNEGYLAIVRARKDSFYSSQENALYIELLANTSRSVPSMGEMKGEQSVLGILNLVEYQALKSELSYLVMPVEKLDNRRDLQECILNSGWQFTLREGVAHFIKDVSS